ncbi:hypothetical protein [Qipengyuania sphaerica]|uniref:hypothetical protein n=1 Tax=Qipengyuania sphaerica TaxID=2867243 RepID=UPI001C87AEA1|nr:hypothetical protein [Qipengyuania sphaerica]MBX7540392.1 hypothetical protein [Qipengyuania sphaerica]
MTFRIISMAALSVTLGACASVADEPAPHVIPIAAEHVISTTASLSNTLVLDRQTQFVTCTAPPPDASFSQGEQASVSAIITGSNDQANLGEDSEETGLTGRSPALLLAREMFFRACEFSRNYQLSKDEALQVYLKTMDATTSSFAVENGGNGGYSQAEQVVNPAPQEFGAEDGGQGGPN